MIVYNQDNAIQRVPALRVFWDLEKTVLDETRVSGTVLWSPTNANSPNYTYISQKTCQWKPCHRKSTLLLMHYPNYKHLYCVNISKPLDLFKDKSQFDTFSPLGKFQIYKKKMENSTNCILTTFAVSQSFTISTYQKGNMNY